MRVEVAYPGRIEVFDTDRFTEPQPFSGKSMLADLSFDYGNVGKEGLWLEAHCYAANETYREGNGEIPEARREKGWKFQLATPREATEIECVAMDGSLVLARMFGALVDVAKIDRASALLSGLGGSVASRIVRLNDYLANADERLAASPALMTEAIGIAPDVLEQIIAAEAAQEIPADDQDENWMEGYGDD